MFKVQVQSERRGRAAQVRKVRDSSRLSLQFLRGVCTFCGSEFCPRVPKWIKFIIAILLLPVCAGAAMALWQVLCASGGADVVWVPLLAGAACWLVIFLLLPKPMWIYVFGHELTHALWTWLFGGQVKKLKVSSGGGHVVVSKSNFLIALAPYFFPLYVALVVAVFSLGRLFWDWRSYLVWFHLLVGAAYAFHVTLTWHVLKTRQSDITSQGWLFSAVIIFLGNVVCVVVRRPVVDGEGWFVERAGLVAGGHRTGFALAAAMALNIAPDIVNISVLNCRAVWFKSSGRTVWT